MLVQKIIIQIPTIYIKEKLNYFDIIPEIVKEKNRDFFLNILNIQIII